MKEPILAEPIPKLVRRLGKSEQRQTLLNETRKQIIDILSSGKMDYETQTSTKEETLEDGTGLTHLVEVKRPFKRYWMTAPEILEEIKSKYPKSKITNYQCYYHLQILREQQLVEQYPAPQYDRKGKKRRIRGKYFRSSARFFVPCYPEFSGDESDLVLDVLDKGWGISPSENDVERLQQIMANQDRTIIDAMEHLAGQLSNTDTDLLDFPSLLEHAAFVYLSDDEEFIERYQEAKRIFVRSGGYLFEAEVVQSSDEE